MRAKKKKQNATLETWTQDSSESKRPHKADGIAHGYKVIIKGEGGVWDLDFHKDPLAEGQNIKKLL